jgi:hypothetical protein
MLVRVKLIAPKVLPAFKECFLSTMFEITQTRTHKHTHRHSTLSLSLSHTHTHTHTLSHTNTQEWYIFLLLFHSIRSESNAEFFDFSVAREQTKNLLVFHLFSRALVLSNRSSQCVPKVTPWGIIIRNRTVS